MLFSILITWVIVGVSVNVIVFLIELVRASRNGGQGIVGQGQNSKWWHIPTIILLWPVLVHLWTKASRQGLTLMQYMLHQQEESQAAHDALVRKFTGVQSLAPGKSVGWLSIGEGKLRLYVTSNRVVAIHAVEQPAEGIFYCYRAYQEESKLIGIRNDEGEALALCLADTTWTQVVITGNRNVIRALLERSSEAPLE